MSNNNFIPWITGGLGALAVFVLCFLAIDYVSKPEEPKEPEVEEVVIATEQTNKELIALARKQGWIATDATEMTSVDAAHVHDLGNALQGCGLKQFDEFRYFVGVEELQSGAFAGSAHLETITVPRNVISINYGAFADCPSLREMRVDTANTHYDSREDCNGIVCTWKGKLMLVAGCRATRLPEGIRYIAPQAFKGTMGLATIEIPEKMDEIGEEAFRDCKDLAEFTVPQGVRFIEESTFQGCTALSTITLAKSVERLRKDAFKDCPALRRIVCMKKYPPIVENAFDNNNPTVVVPKGMQNAYYTSKYWKDFSNIVAE